MAKIIGTTKDGVLVEMSVSDAKKVSGNANAEIGDEFNLAAIYNKLVWIVANKAKLATLAQEARDFSDNLDAAIDTSGIGGA